MAEKDLKRLSRADLLQILIVLQEKNEELELQLKSAQAQLNDRKILMANSGSIAEAALQLNGVFSAAEAAAEQYLLSIKAMKKNEETYCEILRMQAEQEANEIIMNAKAYSAKVRAEADALLRQAKAASSM